MKINCSFFFIIFYINYKSKFALINSLFFNIIKLFYIDYFLFYLTDDQGLVTDYIELNHRGIKLREKLVIIRFWCLYLINY